MTGTPDMNKISNILEMRVSPRRANKHVEVLAWWKFSVWMKSIEEDICLGSKPQYPRSVTAKRTCECECVSFHWRLYISWKMWFHTKGKPAMNSGCAGTWCDAWEPCDDDEFKTGYMSSVCFELHHTWQHRHSLTMPMNYLTFRWNLVSDIMWV